jgi:N-acetylglucosamine malate deacetylase 1
MHIEPNLALFVLAHPDDEFFCTAFLSDEILAGSEVHCAYLTDGAYGGQSAQRRIDETLSVLARYGVNSTRVHFIGAERGVADGALAQQMSAAWQALRSAVPRAPTRIYTTAWEGGHQDHDACHAVALRMAKECGCSDVRQFALYNGYGTRHLFRVMTPMPGNGPSELRYVSLREIARMLMNAFAYPSQWKTWLGLFPFAAWHLLRMRSIGWQRTSDVRIAERPHAGPLLYERRGRARYEDTHAFISAFLPLPDTNARARSD